MQALISDAFPYANYPGSVDTLINARQRVSSIGGQVRYTFSCQADADVQGKTIVFTPGLYGGSAAYISSPPTWSFQFAVPPTYFAPSIGSFWTMAWSGPSQSQFAFTSIRVGYFNGVNTGNTAQFEIVFEHIVGADIRGWLDPGDSYDSSEHLLKDSQDNPNRLDNAEPDVYSFDDRFISCNIGAYEPSTLAFEQTTVVIPFSARFYGQEFSAGTLTDVSNFTTTLTRGGVGVTSISSLETTTLTMTFDTAAAFADYVMCYAIEANPDDDEVAWWNNAGVNGTTFDGGVNSAINGYIPDGAFVATAASTIARAGTTNTFEFDLDPTYFTDGVSYRFVFVVFPATPSGAVSSTNGSYSLISDAFVGSAIRDGYTPTVQHEFRDYYNAINSNYIEATVAERLSTVFTIDIASLQAQWAGAGLSTTYADYIGIVKCTATVDGVIVGSSLINTATAFQINSLAEITRSLNPTTDEYDCEFRIDPAWAGKSVVFTWEASLRYSDLADGFEVYRYVTQADVVALDVEGAGNRAFTTAQPFTFEDDNGDAVATFCVDGSGSLGSGKILFNSPAGTAENADIITVHGQSTQNINEFLEENEDVSPAAAGKTQIGNGYVTDIEDFDEVTDDRAVVTVDLNAFDNEVSWDFYVIAYS